MEDVVQSMVHKKLVMYGASQKGKLTPVCKIEVAVSSISIADEFDRHLQDINMDIREDLHFLSDELEEEECLSLIFWFSSGSHLFLIKGNSWMEMMDRS